MLPAEGVLLREHEVKGALGRAEGLSALLQGRVLAQLRTPLHQAFSMVLTRDPAPLGATQQVKLLDMRTQSGQDIEARTHSVDGVDLLLKS